MNIKRAKDEIKNCIAAYLLKDGHGEYAIPAMRQRPLLLMGPPGIGKTQIMEQVARECQVGLVSYTITHHTRQSAIGLPFIEKRKYGGAQHAVTEYTMSEIVASIYDYIERTGMREGILFIDEINCVSETLAPTMLQFLQYKTFGNHKIPDGWIIVTAGNPPEYNKSVREFDIATLDRIKKIDVEADFDVWKEYAQQTAVHPAVIAYLEARRDHFYRIETTVDGRFFATPRGWEDMARFLEIYEKLGKTVDRDVVYQYIEHPGIAKDFAAFLELYYKYRADYRIDKLLSGHAGEDLIRRVLAAPFDEKLSVIHLILAHLNERFREHYRKESYLEELLEQLKQFKKRVEEGKENDGRGENAEAAETTVFADQMNPSAYLTHLASEMWKNLAAARKAGLVSRSEDYILRDAAGQLEQYAKLLKEEAVVEPQEGLKRVQEWFADESGVFEQDSEALLAMLEHAFDFMEAAFGDSQETVLFVTELNTNYYSVHFLKENECPRYYEYNKRLLFEDREDDIRQRLESL